MKIDLTKFLHLFRKELEKMMYAEVEEYKRKKNLFFDAGRKYKTAVMMTLTNDQKMHANLFEANKSHQENWNRLITKLRKEAKDERVKELVRKNPELLKVKLKKNLLAMPGGGQMAAYEFSLDILTPHSQKSLQAFLEAAYSFQCRTRAARRHEGLQGRNESDSQYFKRIQRETRLSNVTAAELREAAEEHVKSDNSLKFPNICVREYPKNGNVHYHIIIFGIRWLNSSRFYTYSNSLLSDENRPRPVISKGLYEFAGVCGSEYWTYNGDTLVCIEPAGPPPAAATGGD